MSKQDMTPQLSYAWPSGRTLEEMRDAVRQTELYRQGDARLVWVNEGDFLMLHALGVRVTDLSQPGDQQAPRA